MKPLAESLSEADLYAVSTALKWKTCTSNSRKEKIGRPDTPHYPIPHELVSLAQDRFGLAGKTVLEVGCFEGAHTVGLCQLWAKVTAIEGRISNLLCAVMRCALYGYVPGFIRGDVEEIAFPERDIVFHAGVLYHLADPVAQLHKASRAAREGMLLDTHHAIKPREKYISKDGLEYPCADHLDYPAQPKEGLVEYTRRLSLDLIVEILKKHFREVEVVKEYNVLGRGPRVTIVAKGKL